MINIAKIEEIKPNISGAGAITPRLAETRRVGVPEVWGGGTMTFRNTTLFRSNDYFRGGTTVSSDVAQSDNSPSIGLIEDL